MWRGFVLTLALAWSAGTASAQTRPGTLVAPAPAAGVAKPAPPAAASQSPTAPDPGNVAAPQPDSLLTFDYRLADVQWTDGRWQLTAGQVVLKDFGRHETEAREALRLVRELRLTQLGTLGSPRPIAEYWLADGQAPRGLVSGLRTVALDQKTLRAEQLQGQWCVRDANRILFNFGAHADEAREALAVIQRYNFTQIGYVGQASPLMLVLLGSPTGFSAAANTQTHAPSAAPAPRLPDGNSAAVRAGLRQPADVGARPFFAPTPLPLGRQLNAPALGLPGMAVAERVPIDWNESQVRQDRDGWKLVQGSTPLANFGPDEEDARLALAAVRYYHFSEQCLVGRPHPAFSYFLVNGEAPRGAMVGVGTVPFRPEALAVRQVGSDWTVCDGTRPLFHFGNQADEARQALTALQRYKFDTLCRIGHTEPPSLTFPVRTR
jgi:hypothetical protein